MDMQQWQKDILKLDIPMSGFFVNFEDMTLCDNCQSKVKDRMILVYHGQTYIVCSPACMVELLSMLD